MTVRDWGGGGSQCVHQLRGEMCEASGGEADTPARDRDTLTCGQCDVCVAENKCVVNLSVKCV